MTNDNKDYDLGYEEASEQFLECVNEKLEKMGVVDFYCDADLKDAFYGMLKDTIADIEKEKNSKTSAGIQVAIDIIKNRFGLSTTHDLKVVGLPETQGRPG